MKISNYGMVYKITNQIHLETKKNKEFLLLIRFKSGYFFEVSLKITLKSSELLKLVQGYPLYDLILTQLEISKLSWIEESHPYKITTKEDSSDEILECSNSFYLTDSAKFRILKELYGSL